MTPTPVTLRSVGAAALLSVLVLAGCSEEEPLPEPTSPTTSAPTTQAPPVDDEEATTVPADDEEATQTAAPGADSKLVAADGSLTIELPEGWENACDLADQDGVLLAAKEIERKDEFFTNVVVTEEEYVSNLTSAVEEAAEELAGEDGEYELLEPAPVDGNRAPGYTLVRDVQGSTIHQTQRWISHDGTLYVVTFSAIESQATEAADVLSEMLDSWRWQDPPLEPPVCPKTSSGSSDAEKEAELSSLKLMLDVYFGDMPAPEQARICGGWQTNRSSALEAFMEGFTERTDFALTHTEVEREVIRTLDAACD